MVLGASFRVDGISRHPLFIFYNSFGWKRCLAMNKRKRRCLNVDKLEKLPKEIESGLELPPDVTEHQRIIGTMRNGEDTSDALELLTYIKSLLIEMPAKTGCLSHLSKAT